MACCLLSFLDYAATEMDFSFPGGKDQGIKCALHYLCVCIQFIRFAFSSFSSSESTRMQGTLSWASGMSQEGFRVVCCLSSSSCWTTSSFPQCRCAVWPLGLCMCPGVWPTSSLLGCFHGSCLLFILIALWLVSQCPAPNGTCEVLRNYCVNELRQVEQT